MRTATFIAALAVFFGTQSGATAAPLADFIDYSLYSTRGPVILPGRLFVPPEAAADPLTPRPLMLFLHGGGAIGTNNITQVEHTPDYLLDEAKRRGAFLYVPQAPSGWTDLNAIASVMTMINRAVAERPVDDDRLYATGYSNGGGGTWNLLTRNPGRFAAAATVSAVAPVAGFNAANLVDTPIFALHARDDATVPVSRTRTVVASILTAAGQRPPPYGAVTSMQTNLVANPLLDFHRFVIDSSPPESTVFHNIARPDLDLLYFEPANGGHTGLLGVYFLPEFYDWMFSHSLAVPEPSTATLLALALALSRKRKRPEHPR
jgi:poly(3-hydroxybutyrate) depolymerase